MKSLNAMECIPWSSKQSSLFIAASPLDDLLATLCHNSDTISLYSAL